MIKPQPCLKMYLATVPEQLPSRAARFSDSCLFTQNCESKAAGPFFLPFPLPLPLPLSLPLPLLLDAGLAGALLDQVLELLLADVLPTFTQGAGFTVWLITPEALPELFPLPFAPTLPPILGRALCKQPDCTS